MRSMPRCPTAVSTVCVSSSISWKSSCSRRDLLPSALALLDRQDLDERLHRVQLAAIELERLERGELIAAFLLHAPGQAQPCDAHALIDRHHAENRWSQALED